MPLTYRQGRIPDFFFSCGPDYWRIRAAWWIALVITVLSYFTVIGLFPGIGVTVFLFALAHSSKSEWRHVETLRAIKESGKANS